MLYFKVIDDVVYVKAFIGCEGKMATYLLICSHL